MVALSTIEAEYMALSTAAKEAVWLAQLMSKVSGTTKGIPIPIHVNNQGAIALA